MPGRHKPSKCGDGSLETTRTIGVLPPDWSAVHTDAACVIRLLHSTHENERTLQSDVRFLRRSGGFTLPDRMPPEPCRSTLFGLRPARPDEPDRDRAFAPRRACLDKCSRQRRPALSKEKTIVEPNMPIGIDVQPLYLISVSCYRLRLAFHDESPSLAIVYNSFNDRKRGRSNLTDDLREGRPSTATTEDKISAVCLDKLRHRCMHRSLSTKLSTRAQRRLEADKGRCYRCDNNLRDSRAQQAGGMGRRRGGPSRVPWVRSLCAGASTNTDTLARGGLSSVVNFIDYAHLSSQNWPL
ncbi:hypothetical protein EVAR_62311_1 [Eumeta japonica]|uniref:Uncharacterized protein n=1 Tax=Eumeta variegata TaxID=151549 RepID=A0A4C1ZI46_EUMVA|nr:hypothetical protein EVAR_62311_1 [Eumeta japonica]